MSIKVMSFNIWNYNPPWEARRAAIVSAIQAQSPDIIGFQEIQRGIGKDEAGCNQAEQLAARLPGYETIYQPAHPMPGRGWEGLAIFSRYPIRRGGYTDLSRDPEDPEDRHQRIVLAAEIATPEGVLVCFNTHLSLSRPARSRTAREVVEFVTRFAEGRPLVLIGDFNDLPDSEPIAFLRQHFTDAWQELHPLEPGYTWHVSQPQRRIDYIFTAGGVHILSCELAACQPGPEGVYPSDHCGLVATIELNVE